MFSEMNANNNDIEENESRIIIVQHKRRNCMTI